MPLDRLKLHVPSADPDGMSASGIALTMIVRDASETLERALLSARDLVDEMIVVDTGSVDDTAQIAQDLGAQVSHFTWIDDFAAARNAALERATSRWRLVLDADEWIETSSPVPLPAPSSGVGGTAEVVSTIEMGESTSRSTTTSVRLLGPDARYTGRVHEQPSVTRAFPSGLVIAHDGYLPRQRARKQGRNAALLRMALAEDPNPYLHFQLGKELAIYDDHLAAVAEFEAAYQEAPADAPWRHDLVIRALYSLKMARGFAEALDLLEAEEPNWRHSADFHYVKGDVLLDISLAHPEGAGELIPLIEQSWLECLRLGDSPHLSGPVAGRGSFLAARALSALYGALGDLPLQQRYSELAKSGHRPLNV